MPDTFEIEVLPDGTLKIECGKISGPSHLNAENFLREVQKLAGGPVKVRHTHAGHSHSHSHGNQQHQH